MSGCGRKHRAKHITREYLDDDSWAGPQGKEEIAVSLESPHGKHLHVYVVPPPSSELSSSSVDTTTTDRRTSTTKMVPQVVYLPGKFQKVIWIGVKDVIVILDGAVHRKPSPAQLAIFLESSPHWKQTILEVCQLVASERPGASSEPACVEDVAEAPVPADGDDLDLINPNRNNIRHHQAYFGDEDGEDEDGEDEDGDDAEEEEDEEEDCQ